MISRILLTVGTLAFAGAGSALMLKGWRSRQRRQADLPAPPVPTGAASVVVPAVPGLFVGTTGADDWLDRIAVHRLSDRATSELVLGHDGVHITRDDLPELWIPLASVVAVAVETSLAGKVVSSGMLVVSWQLGDRTLASAFRATDPADHGLLLEALSRLLLDADGSPLPSHDIPAPLEVQR